MLKKIFIAFLALCILSLVSCGEDATTDNDTTTAVSEQAVDSFVDETTDASGSVSHENTNKDDGDSVVTVKTSNSGVPAQTNATAVKSTTSTAVKSTTKATVKTTVKSEQNNTTATTKINRIELPIIPID